jgi:endonuclease/exonuclease/phosphatase (EEP) superfamily protein YafD
VRLPNGELLVVIPQHFKSKRGGNSQSEVARRKAQVERAAAIVQAALLQTPFVIVAGDFNDTPNNVLGSLRRLALKTFRGNLATLIRGRVLLEPVRLQIKSTIY